MLIVALGRTAPVESVTVPVTVPTGACADMSRIMQQNRQTSSTADRLHIELPRFLGRIYYFPSAGVNDCDNVLHSGRKYIPAGAQEFCTSVFIVGSAHICNEPSRCVIIQKLS